MPDKRIVNASPLVFLAREGLLDLLREEGFDVIVPEAVLSEIEAHGLDDPTVESIRHADWLTIAPSITIPPEIANWDLGAGESAVLSLALSESAAFVVIDDRDARRCAKSLSIPLIGTLGLILLAKIEGLIPEARPVVERLRGSGIYHSDQVISESLARVGEQIGMKSLMTGAEKRAPNLSATPWPITPVPGHTENGSCIQLFGFLDAGTSGFSVR